jgi:hypothetical protein
VVGCYENGTKHSDSIKGSKFLEKPRYYQFLKNCCTEWCQLLATHELCRSEALLLLVCIYLLFQKISERNVSRYLLTVKAN